jgi:fucose 4-O-acetylase-like acetyltransferase
MESAAGRSRSTHRLVWLDATKGSAIVLVVFGHVLGGAMARGWLQNDGFALVTYDFIYLFHMPLFFLIGGAFAIDGVRTNPRAAMLSRLGSILWPYTLWGTINIFMDPLVDRFRGSPHNEPNLLSGFYHLLVGDWSWFLGTFFLAHCLLIVTRAIPSAIVFVLSLIASLVLSQSDLGTFGPVIGFMPYMALGAVIGRDNLVAFFESRWSSPAFGVALLALLFALAGLAHDTAVLNNTIVAFVCGVVGSLALIMLAKGYRKLQIERVLAFCGAASLVVFLLHPYFQGAARALTLELFGTAAWAQLALVTLIGLAGPTFLWWLSERYGFRWLFRLSYPRAAEQAPASIARSDASAADTLKPVP